MKILNKKEKVEYDIFMEGVPTKILKIKNLKIPEDFRNY